MEFSLSVQNEHGYWGKLREYDGQRNAFLAHYLHWYYENINQDPKAEAAAEKFTAFILDPANTYNYGINNLVRVTGFVGLVFASFIYSELDIRLLDESIPLCDYKIDQLRSIAEKWKTE